jgi:DNA-3-methyladenine glycosylase I
MKERCNWCGSDPLYVAYHDHEWGVPLHDDQKLFELLTLEGAQAGLNWLTILRKRQGYRAAFDGFEIARVAGYSAQDIERLLADPGIIRNRLKIASTISNARGIMAIQREYGSFAAYLWRFVTGRPIQNSWQSLAEIPASTAESVLMSRELKKRGFNFVGPTICYAFMQATGMVNDHLTGCYRYNELHNLT